MKAKFQLFKSTRHQQFYYHLRAANGEIILSGESYTTKRSCEGGIALVKINARYHSRYTKNDAPGNHTFNLHGGNGEIIGRSENYTTAEARDVGLDAVWEEALDAGIVDMS